MSLLNHLVILTILFFGFSILLLGFHILLKRKDQVSMDWFLFCLFSSVWGVGLALQLNNDMDVKKALLVTRISHISAVMIPCTWLKFICSFTEKKLSSYLWFLIGLITCVLLLFSPTPYFILGLRKHSVFNYWPAPGPLYHLFTGLFFFVVSYAFYLIVQAYLDNSKSAQRKQLGTLSLACLVGFLGGSSTFIGVYKDYHWAPFGIFLLLGYPFLMSYAMARHGVLDIEQIAAASHRDKLAAIGTLATSINHEIRNPLYVIKGLAESHFANIKDGIYKDAQDAISRSDSILQKAMDQAQRAMDIMKRLSDFAKKGVDQKAHIEEIDLKKTLEDVLPLIRHELELDKIELVNNIPDDLPPIRADRRHIEEILFNLIVNACQAMKETGGKITIKAYEKQIASGKKQVKKDRLSPATRNGAIELTITDTGPGIPPEKINQIFEPFYTTKE